MVVHVVLIYTTMELDMELHALLIIFHLVVITVLVAQTVPMLQSVLLVLLVIVDVILLVQGRTHLVKEIVVVVKETQNHLVAIMMVEEEILITLKILGNTILLVIQEIIQVAIKMERIENCLVSFWPIIIT